MKNNTTLVDKLKVMFTRRQKNLAIVVMAMFISATTVWAATHNPVFFQPEDGTLSEGAVAIDDTSASNGKAVKFTDASSPFLADDAKGWEIDETNVGLAPLGLSCSSLPVYTGSRNVPAGTTIYRQRVTQTLNVSAGNVTIDQSCVQPTSSSGFLLAIVDPRNVSTCPTGDGDCILPNDGLVIRDSEIDASLLSAQTIAGTCAVVGNGTFIRNYMHSMGSGICFYGTGLESSGLAKHNYVTGLRSYGESHNEAATVRDLVKNASDTRSVRIIGNRMFCDGNVTATVFLQPTWDDIYNVWLTDNYFEGGGYNIYSSGGQTGAHIGNAHATNNRVRATGWGPAAVDNVEGFVEWTDNYIYNPANPGARGSLIPDPS